VTPYKIIREARKHGWLLLTADGRLHVELPAGHEELLAELRAQKEKVRTVLARRDAKGKRKTRPQTPPPPGEPVSIPVMCRCGERSYPHMAHRQELEPKPDIRLSGMAVWEFLKEQVRLAQEKKKP
jgi:hypothetical protein